ncbi:hypothetical protein HWV62_17060 [Athelia sp. TMB]|nr:hypothetical protein HWV62_17060 [Athelia sp. TMB]
MSAHFLASASPVIVGREQLNVNGTIYAYDSTLCINQTPPDSDLMGLGVRLGLYFQILALALGVACGESDTLSAVPAAIMTSLTLNIVLSMKAGEEVFQANPVVQDFWVTQLQLYLLVTLLPFMFMFGRWHHKQFGLAKCVLVAIAIIYTYAQTFWFWLAGYKKSDEQVCGVAETTLFDHIRLFSQGGRFAIIVMFVFGVAVLVIMLPAFIRGREGVLRWVVLSRGGESDWSKALVMILGSVPLITIVLVMIETAVRTGTQKEWTGVTGQWLSLGVGVFTAAEAIWHVVKAIWRETHGEEFFEGVGFLGEEVRLAKKPVLVSDPSGSGVTETLLGKA